MVRSRKGVEMLVDLINISYCAMKLLPYMETQILIKGQNEETLKIAPDDQFIYAIEFFAACMESGKERKRARDEMIAQGG